MKFLARAAAAIAIAIAAAACGSSGTPAHRDARFVGDFETGDLSQWNTLREAAPDRITVVTDPVRQGRYAARVEVRPGDRVSTGERAELLRDPHGDERQGDSFYYGWSVLFPDGWTEPYGWGIIVQFHSPFFVPPPLAIDQRDGGLWVEGRGGQYDAARSWSAKVLPTVQTGVWHDFVMFVHWDADHGVVKVWHRLATQTGWKLAAAVQDAPDIQTDDGVPGRNGMRMGLYRNTGGDATNVLYIDGMHRETTFAAAAAGLGPPLPAGAP